MPSPKVDWEFLRGALGLCGISVVLSAVLVWGSYYFRQQMDVEYRTHHAKFRDASRQYLEVDDEARIIEQHFPEFVRLYRHGVIGGEQRLNWLETLKTAGAAIALPEISYRVESQKPYEPAFAINLGTYELRSSDMQLTLGLLHEGDLLRLISALDRDAAGLYSVDHCVLKRDEKQTEVDAHRPNIRAECNLQWFTVDLRGERKVSL